MFLHLFKLLFMPLVMYWSLLCIDHLYLAFWRGGLYTHIFNCVFFFFFFFFVVAVFSHGYLSTKTWSIFFLIPFTKYQDHAWHLIPSLHSKQMGKKWEQWHILFSWAPKSLWIVTAVMKLKYTCSLEEKL